MWLWLRLLAGVCCKSNPKPAVLSSPPRVLSSNDGDCTKADLAGSMLRFGLGFRSPGLPSADLFLAPDLGRELTAAAIRLLGGRELGSVARLADAIGTTEATF